MSEEYEPEGLCSLCVFWSDCVALGYCQIDKHEILISAVEQRSARLSHKQEVVSSNLTLATNYGETNELN